MTDAAQRRSRRPRPGGAGTRPALRYALLVAAGRGLVFAGLLVAAARLAPGGYAEFALAYQIALFVAYQAAYPSVIAGYHSRSPRPVRALLARAAASAAAAAPLAALAGLVLLPDPRAALLAAAAAQAAAVTVAVAANGEAQGRGFATTFVRLNAIGSATFLVLAAVVSGATAMLLAAAAASVFAPLAFLARRSAWSAAALAAAPPAGRTSPPAVAAANLALNLTYPALLFTANAWLPPGDADTFAIALTFLQVAMLPTLQLVSFLQPAWIARDDVVRAQGDRDVAALAALSAAAAIAAGLVAHGLGWDGGLLLALLAPGVIGYGWGLAAGNALLIAAGEGRRLPAGPFLYAAVLVAALAAASAADTPQAIAVAFALATLPGALWQARIRGSADATRLVLALAAAAAACLAVGALLPLAGAALALVAAAAARRPIAASLGRLRGELARSR